MSSLGKDNSFNFEWLKRRLLLYKYKLAWEPSVAQGTHCYSGRFPVLIDFNGKINSKQTNSDYYFTYSVSGLDLRDDCPGF